MQAEVTDVSVAKTMISRAAPRGGRVCCQRYKESDQRGREMSTDLKMLAWVSALTLLFWLPYTFSRLNV
jgi:hypothetical protein